MKKIPLFLSILTASLLGNLAFLAPNSSALYQEGDTTWWTVEEILEFSHQVDAEREALCQGDQECNMEFHFSMYEKGEKYRALENLLQMQFWVTSVNPGTETIKVLYFDEDMMLKRMGIEEKANLDQLFFGWFETWNGQIYNYNPDTFGGDVILHTVFEGSAETNGAGWLPAGREIELSVPGSNLVNNLSGRLDYSAYSDGYFNAQGYFDYSSCLSAYDYTEGVECKMMISGDQWITYLPPRETVISTNQDTDSDTDDVTIFQQTEDDAHTSPQTENTDTTTETNNETTDSQEVTATEDSATVTSVTTSQSTKTPNTGAPTSPEGESSEFPWWFQLVLMLGGATFLWLFWPSSKHHAKKLKKSRKKGVDSFYGI